MEAEDSAELLELLASHVHHTGSPLASELLAAHDRGEDVLARFTRIVPADYAAVLEIQAQCAESGLDPEGDEAWTTILEATHG